MIDTLKFESLLKDFFLPMFSGYGAGAAIARVDATDFWRITYQSGAAGEVIQLIGVTALDASDYQFV